MKKIISMLFIILLILAINIKSSGQDGNIKNKIDELAAGYFKDNGPGCAILVSKNGEIVYESAFGLADIDGNVKMKPGMIFRIGSITKQFTAVAILKLMEEGKLSLQDDITEFIPDYPVNGKSITIEHLLTHTSGIKSYTGMAEFDPATQQKKVTPVELIAFFKDQPSEFDPRTMWSYNNSGYVLLGYIIEKVTGKSYGDYIETEFFKPLGMKNSFYGEGGERAGRRVQGYVKQGDGFALCADLDMSWPYSAGSLLSNVRDLNRWNSALHNSEVISKAALQKAFTEYKLSNGKSSGYGYGWFIGYLDTERTIEHGGGINGFVTNAIYVPGSDVFVAVLSNIESSEASDLSERIAAIMTGRPYEFKKIQLDGETLSEYMGIYIDEDGTERTVGMENGELYSHRLGGNRFKIYAYEPDKFFFEESMTKMDFERDAGGKVAALIMRTRRLPASRLVKSDKAVEEKKAVEVSEEVLKHYTRVYEFDPAFLIEITYNEGSIYAEPTGQPKFRLYPESQNTFFLKEVDAQLEFVKNASGEVEKLVLHQGGQEMEGKRQE